MCQHVNGVWVVVFGHASGAQACMHGRRTNRPCKWGVRRRDGVKGRRDHWVGSMDLWFFFKWALFDDFLFSLDNWALDIKWAHDDNNK